MRGSVRSGTCVMKMGRVMSPGPEEDTGAINIDLPRAVPNAFRDATG
jgi:hypothetical protein